MSGTSLDGVDAILLKLAGDGKQIIKTAYRPYPDSLRQAILDLHHPEINELVHSQIIACQLAHLYALTVADLLSELDPKTLQQVAAIGCHGQTIRHRPELGFTVQLNNPSLLAELTNITVVADFRSRDIAAGGQGAPLVPAFHQAVFAHSTIHRTILNIGGICNLTDLPPDGKVTGFDSGPGNLLMDAWCQRHTDKTYDFDGQWAQTGQCIASLLDRMLAEPFFAIPPPKSTGRDTFNMRWLEQRLAPDYASHDVQATLLELSCRSIADAVMRFCCGTREIYLCGGGAKNRALVDRLKTLLPGVSLAMTDDLGISVDWVEAAAFAWLAKQALEGKAGSLPAVTGASGPRILGAIYPA